MPTEFWNQVPRRPRYQANGSNGIRAEIQCADGNAVPVQLQDLSRMGFQLRVPRPLAVGEIVLLKLRIEESAPAMAWPATVQWQRSTDDEAWLIGCLCEHPVDWESLGELFLNGAISQDGS
jgi:hypothetical protein